ncbi:uncharacterized protein Triagg1_7873 [Trichoderma aggressivum f. europaeum]|uniref:Nucleoside phosphorylase domain-containing protein n=1 Tax=Trichoderma aggressivum f. europaeum TaxID=173218 RepID=A0AAE1IB06_9HYPO|nr:hypothetical protein Triagg1_7873 [Trichoderma aggressivum f. europaeum]
MTSKPLSHNAYSVGWICALSEERTAATAMLDERHDPLPMSNPHDANSYTLGAVGKHNVVLVCLPEGEIGTNSAASVIMQLVNSFPSIKFGLLVGIGGEELAKKWPRLASKYTWNDVLTDTLFVPENAKPTNNAWQTIATLMGYLPGYKEPKLIRRTNNADAEVMDDERTPGDPEIHYGLIASGNQVIKDGSMRDEINARSGGKVLCVEMEAAGMMNNFPRLVIRGICDYADSKKNDHWHGYAAGIAAAFTKELLQIVRPAEIDGEPSARDVLNQVYQSVGHIQLKMDQVEEKQILDWLTPTDYGSLHSDYSKRFNLELGSGSSNEDDSKIGLRVATIHSYVYLNYNRQEDQDVQKLLASLLKQLAGGCHPLPESTKELYNEHLRGRTRESLEELKTDLRRVITKYSEVFIILDALDECQYFELNLFLSTLFELQKEHVMRILTTSRPIPEIMDWFDTLNSIKLQIRAKARDVTKYIDAHIDRSPKVARESPTLRNEIKSDISEATDGMFLLAQIYLVLLQDKTTVSDIRKQLVIFKSRNTENKGDRKGKILAYAYEQAIDRIRNQKEGIRNLAMRALAWVTLARRQITTSELRHALATQQGMTTLSHDDLPDLADIVSACVGLLTVDEESRIIRPVHYTTHEYLEQTHSCWFPSAEESILRSCLTCLLFDVFESGSCQSDEAFEHRIRSFPLFHYAANHWECHLSHNTGAMEDVIHFLESQPNVEASMQARFFEKQHPLHHNYSQNFPSGMTGLHASAVLGLTEAPKLLLGRGHGPDAIDDYKFTPLSCASFYGHEAVAELLVCAGANLEVKDLRVGRTPLIQAAAEGHEAVVKLLIEKGGDVNAQDGVGRTPLSVAAFYKHKTVIELLSQSDGTIDAKDSFGKASLFYSTGLRAMNMFPWVGAKEKPNVTQNNTPSKPNDVDIHQLMESGADLSAKDDGGRTPLSHAAEFGELDIVQSLIETNKVDVNEADGETGMTPLHWAVVNGHLSVVELLVSAGAQLEMKEMQYQMTALVLVIHHKQKPIFDLLLQKDANVHVSDVTSETTLYHAARWGELAVIQQLIDRGVDVNARIADSYTAIFQSIRQGNLGAVKLLVEKGADVDASTQDGYTPLHCAAIGNIDITRMLVERGADVNAKHDGHTALPLAVVTGNIDIVRLLVQAGADVDVRVHHSATPLMMSPWYNLYDIIQPLVDLGADVNATDKLGNSPLLYAIFADNVRMVELLVGMEDIDVNSPDPEGKTPIYFAKCLKRHRIIKTLLESVAFSFKKKENIVHPKDGEMMMVVQRYFMPLQRCDGEAIVELMMDAVDVRSPDATGMTPTAFASNV